MEHQSVCEDIYRHLYGFGWKQKLLHYRVFLMASKLLSSMMTQLIDALVAQSRPSESHERLQFLDWLMRKPGFAVLAAKEALSYFSPRFIHWARQEEDEALIHRSLVTVYPEATT